MAVITAQEVANRLGITYDAGDVNLGDCTDAAVAWVRNRRSLTPDVVLWSHADVRLGAKLYAVLLYEAKAAPAGYPGYEEFSPVDANAAAMGTIRTLVGYDPVLA